MSDALVTHEQPPIVDVHPRRTFRRIPLLPHQLTERITPARDVFVLGHVGIPRARAEDWCLDVVGLVARPKRFSFAELTAMPKRDVTALHECAGFPMRPEIAARRYANVVWSGVDLASLLEAIGVSNEAAYLWSYGVDKGVYEGVESPVYLKDLPISRMSTGDIILAYEMNHQPLDCEHGFPIRLVVPGYYGTNSVKWLYRLELADRRPVGPFTTQYYNDRVPASADNASGDDVSARTKPVWAFAPESVIVAPAPDETIARGPVDIWGWAWADGPVATVDVSIDGETWLPADVEPASQWSWQRFSYRWIAERPGSYVLMSRATSPSGETQPPEKARNAIYHVPIAIA